MAATLNPWHRLRPPVGAWQPTRRATVVIPYFEALPELRRTLVALAAQTYPAALTEVVVVDDGSPTPLSSDDVADLMSVRVVNRPDEGFALAAARNDGAAVAIGDVLVFLDCDMIPDPSWLEHHLRWHHVGDRLAVLGFRDHVDTDWLEEHDLATAMALGGLGTLVGDRAVERPEWIEFHLSRTRDLTSDDTDMFRVVTGGNLSVGRALFEEVGGFDRSFVRWGGEDTEFGFRVWNAGALLVPERGAHCWHQGLGVTPDPTERTAQEIQRRKLAHLIPHHGFRESVPGHIWQRPRVVAEVGPGTAEARLATARALLGVDDLVVSVAEANDPLVVEDLAPDPRVHLDGDPGDLPHTPYVLTVPAGLEPTADAVEALLADATVDGVTENVQGVVGRYRRRVALDAADAGRSAVEFRPARPPSRARKAVDRLARIRSWDDARSVARWASGAIGRRIGNSGPIGPSAPPTARATPPDPWERIRVLGVDDLPDGRGAAEHVDLVVVDRAADRPIEPGAPVLVLEERPDRDVLTAPVLDRDGVAALLAFGVRAEPAAVMSLLDRRPGPRTRTILDREWPHDVLAREAMLEAARRAVLSEHSGPARRSALLEAAGLPATLPTVTAVVPTIRPERLGRVLDALGRQTYRHLEVVVVAHGVGVGDGLLRRLGDVPVEVVAVDRSVPFGAALRFGTRAAGGDLVAKLDDDDWYGPAHIEDLVLAHLVTGAELVGKGAEFVHLEQRDETIRRFVGGAWTSSPTIAGGALAVSRRILLEVGDWRPVHRHVDLGLIEDVRRAGGSLFRTHAFGYVLVRHGSHTWDAADERFLDQAEGRWDGLPDVLLSGDPVPPHP